MTTEAIIIYFFDIDRGLFSPEFTPSLDAGKKSAKIYRSKAVFCNSFQGFRRFSGNIFIKTSASGSLYELLKVVRNFMTVLFDYSITKQQKYDIQIKIILGPETK